MNFIYALPTRRKIDIDSPLAIKFDITEIAYALARICRFNGYTPSHYSVAQHSIYVCNQLPPELQMAGLLHDAAEAYLGDVTRPVKSKLGEYQFLEDVFGFAISKQFNTGFPMDTRVKEADDRMMCTEAIQFYGFHEVSSWGLTCPPYDMEILCYDQRKAEMDFLEKYHSLVV